MERGRSLDISAYIGRLIAQQAPRIRWTEAELAEFYATYTDDELAEMEEIGILQDQRAFFVMQRFLMQAGLEGTEGDYLLPLLRNARCLDALAFRNNPYIRTISTVEARMGSVTLTTASYARGELFQYAMPDFSEEIVVPRLGFFDRTVKFPTIYEGNTPWMSVCPSEVTSMEKPISQAHGNVLVLGLGLGYYPFMISLTETVRSIVIVEKNPAIIRLFERHLLPHFPGKDKIHVAQDDAFAYLDQVSSDSFDFCFCDIWEGLHDGLPLYRRLKCYEEKLVRTEFAYWIEDQLKAYGEYMKQ